MMSAIRPNTPTSHRSPASSCDKLNQVDFHWFIVRSLPHQEKKLAHLLLQHQKETPNLLEVYCPTHTTVNVNRGGKTIQTPLFAGFVFVLATQQVVSDFMHRHYPEGAILYDHRKTSGRNPAFLTIPEEQMKFFKDFNENYAEQVIVLERPYTDYAFNTKTGEPNEIVRVVSGPLAGREGYLTRFRRDRRLVFNLKSFGSDKYYAVSIPEIWNFHVVRLHNAKGDRQTLGTIKLRAADLLAGLLQACGYQDQTLPMLHRLIADLAEKPSFTALCRRLRQQDHEALACRLTQLNTQEAELLLNLARYEHDNPGYTAMQWSKMVIRPFLTPTPGMEMKGEESHLAHADFTEIIRRVTIDELTYNPDEAKSQTLTTCYYAHIGILPKEHEADAETNLTLFANWDDFLDKYFLTAGKANERLLCGTTPSAAHSSENRDEKEKLLESFRNFAPTLYRVLSGKHPSVRPIPNFPVGNKTLHVMAATTTIQDSTRAKEDLIQTCTRICTEINSTPHLAVWRRYLQTVWLHQ